MIPKYPKRPRKPAYDTPEGPHGRQVCTDTAAGKRLYYERTRLMSERQDHLCAICGTFLVSPTFDHERTRRLGRDDRIEVDGRWINASLCWECNTTKGSRRYAWNELGQYQPVS